MADAIAARMAAGTLIESTGRWVMLRTPYLAASGDVTEQLGLAVPEFQDVPLGPVVYRKSRATVSTAGVVKAELMVPAAAAEKLAGGGYSAVETLFQSAFGVLVDGVLMEILSVTPAAMGDEAYLYRIGLQMPALS